MSDETITTRTRLRQAIRECSSVWARIAYGTNEEYFQITKKTAQALAAQQPENVEDTSTSMGNFAVLSGGELTLW